MTEKFDFEAALHDVRMSSFRTGSDICDVQVDWCQERGIEIRYIQPGKPNQNAFIERFNKSYRDEVLNAHLFSTLDQVREITEKWQTTYNEYRPHDALGRMPPALFIKQLKQENSSYEVCT